MSQVYQVVTDRIIERLNAGVVPWRKSWADGAGLGECRNLVSGAKYRGINAFTTALAGYSSPYFLTYKQALERGGQVRRGEKGLPIVFWSKLEKKAEGAQAGEVSSKDRSIPFVRYFTVFNVEQCDGLDLTGLVPVARSGEFSPIETCERIVSGMPQAPRLIHQEQRAYYSPRLDYVNMPKPESFEKAEEYYSTLFHELTHSTGHESRLDRKLLAPAAFGSPDYSKEELVAEMGSAFLCAVAGIDSPVIDNQAAYINGWLKVLKGDPKLVVQAAAQAQKAADFIRAIKPEEVAS